MGRTCVGAGNTLAGERVVAAMVEYMDAHPDETFGLRLVNALIAAESAGGDTRGKQAAGICTIPASLAVWGSDYVDIRVDDAPDPFAELLRLYRLRWG